MTSGSRAIPGGGGLNQASDVPPGEPGYRKVVLPSAEAQREYQDSPFVGIAHRKPTLPK